MSIFLALGMYFLSLFLVILDFSAGIPDKTKRRIFNLMCLVLVFIAAVSKTEQTNYDTKNYISYFEHVWIDSWKNLGSYYFEPGYVVLNFVIKMMGFSYHILFFVCALIPVLIYRTMILKYAKYIFLCLHVYIACYYFLNEMIIIRHGIAAAFLIYNCRNLAEGKKMKSVLTVVAGSMFHTIALAGFIPVIIVFAEGKRKKLAYLIFVAGMILAFFVAIVTPARIVELLQGTVSVIFPALDNKIAKLAAYSQMADAAGYRRMVLYFPFLVLSIWELSNEYRKRQNNHDKIMLVVFSYYAAAYGCMAAFQSIEEMGRVNSLFCSVIIFAASRFAEGQKNKWSRAAVIGLILFLSMYLYFRNNFFADGGLLGINYY